MNIKVHSSKYKVLEIKRKSSARYAKGVQVGDVISLESVILPVKYGVRYSLLFDVLVNGNIIATQIEQGSVAKMFSDEHGIFIVEELI